MVSSYCGNWCLLHSMYGLVSFLIISYRYHISAIMIFSENQPFFLKVGSAVQKFSGKELNYFLGKIICRRFTEAHFVWNFCTAAYLKYEKKYQPIANIELCNLGTYFNCIMFMVASSVVTTIMILNYHHRLADTHEMPPWVSIRVGCGTSKRAPFKYIDKIR